MVMHKHDTSHNLLQPVNNHNQSIIYNNKIFISSPDVAIYVSLPTMSHPKAVGGMCYAIIEAHIDMLFQT